MSKIQSLGYIVAEANQTAGWKQFGEQVLGMQTSALDNGLRLKMDEREFRIAVEAGAQDRYVASGWDCGSRANFEAAVNALDKAGVAVTRVDAALKSARLVEDLVRFTDPSGNLHELGWGYTGKSQAFAPTIDGMKGYKTGVYGLGHTVLPALQFDATLALFRDVLGMGLSDVFNFQPGPDAPVIRIYFLHGSSGRHHSLALAEMPAPSGCVHMMVETNTLTDVGLAHDRMSKHGIKLMATLGEHENDRMTSFYMQTPGGFAMEYGYGGLIVDPATFKTTYTQQVSIWGHDFSVGFR